MSKNKLMKSIKFNINLMCYMVSLVIQIYYLTYEYDKLFSDFMFHEDKSLSAFSYHCVVILGNI